MLRQVRLKSAYADRYFPLEPEVWYTAAAAAGLVKGLTIVREGPQIEIRDRVLSPLQFEFRGGVDHRVSWGDRHSRRTDRQFPGDKRRHRLGLLQAI